MIVLDNLSIGYKAGGIDIAVAHGICQSLKAGELTCLLGANGVGKSTLLKTLSAFIPPLNGTISVDGRQLNDYTDKELARTIGVVLTEKPAAQNLTVETLVSLGRSPYTGFWGNCTADDMATVGEAMEMVGISHLASRHISTLSDGERQKAMIAKALAQQTSIIILDEPTAFLDYPSKAEMMLLLHDISRKTDKTIFMSTHDVELALQLADTLWLMSKEEALRCGTPRSLSADGSLSAFFTHPGITFDAENMVLRVRK